MANKKISQLTAKGTALAATDLVEISESNGAGGYVTKSVTGANVVSGLQATLVSGTNIKTINSNTILGSGDLVIAGGGGVHVLTKPVLGRSYSLRTNATTTTANSFVSANVIALSPFIPANSLTISNLQLNVTSAVAANIRILVYSDLNGVPSSRLIESTNLDASTTGVKTFTTSYTFTAGTVYWIGAFASASIQVSVLDAAQMTPISTNAFTTAYSSVFASATFPTAPSTLGTATLSSSTSNLCAINLTAA
jgi:hypothetical protein